jgi:FAD synthase
MKTKIQLYFLRFLREEIAFSEMGNLVKAHHADKYS